MKVIYTETKRFIKFENQEDFENQLTIKLSGVHHCFNMQKGFVVDNHFLWIFEKPKKFPCCFSELLNPDSYMSDRSTLAWQIPENDFPQD